MTKASAAIVAFFVAYFISLKVAARAGTGDSHVPEHVALQTREDIGGIFALLVIANGLLAAILVTLIF